MSETQSPLVILQRQLSERENEFARALPAHMLPNRFTRVTMTAVQNDLANPYSQGDLLRADRASFFRACLQCAQDGLLPDGREAVLIAYKGQATYQPMIAGIRKKVRQSGEIVSWEARLAHQHDEFEIVLGDDERIVHKPLLHGDRGPIVAVYSRAVFKDGFISRDWMTIAEVEAIRRRAKTQTVWTSDYGEMVKKTMLKRHSKALPLSAELDKLMERENDGYELSPSLQPIAAQRVPDGDGIRIQYDIERSNSNGAAKATEKKKRGRPRLADLRPQAEPEPAASTVAPEPVLAAKPEADTGQELEQQPSENAIDFYSMGFDSYYDGKNIRPYPAECRGHENKDKAQQFEQGWYDAQKEDSAGDDADTESAEVQS